MEFILFLVHLVPAIHGLGTVQDITIKDIEVPEIIDFREIADLSCTYDIGNHTLNSVKWYKDGKELFR